MNNFFGSPNYGAVSFRISYHSCGSFELLPWLDWGCCIFLFSECGISRWLGVSGRPSAIIDEEA
jgi:hypothetical protein